MKTDIKNILDAVTASPDHHKVLFENDHVRVLDTHIGPGERTAVHVHSFPSVAYYLAAGDIVRYDADGTVEIDTRALGIHIEPGAVTWVEPSAPHSVENVGTHEIRAITVELKRYDRAF
jgi:mannose-6-phosphate isomerase-like protein (cupin superfamily)